MEENRYIETIKYTNFCGMCTTGNCKECSRKQAKDAAIKALEDVQQYRKIGTIEECREAVKKQKPLKPIWSDEEGYQCPVCGERLFWRGKAYCYCGQHIDWWHFKGINELKRREKMKYTIETTENGVIETLEINEKIYKKEWIREGGCLRSQQKEFYNQMEDDGYDNELLDKVYETFTGYIASSVDDMRELLLS